MKMPDTSVLDKVINNEATAKDARETVRWFATQQGQDWLSKQMDSDEERIHAGQEELFIDHAVPTGEMYGKIMRKVHWQKRRRILFSAAAILIPLLLIAGLFVELNSRVDLFAASEYAEVFVPKGERMQLMFQDGSRVYLNSESRIRYPRKFNMKERKVELEGEAWFEVAQNKNRPFIVDLQVIGIQVLGTTFNVKAYDNEPEIAVSLETGGVEINGRTFKTFAITPGEKALYNRSTGKCEIVRPKEIQAASLWKQNTLAFTDAPLSEVMATLGRTYDVTFSVANEEVNKYTYTLRTNFTEIALVLEELEKITPVRFDEDNGVIRVWLKE